MRFIFSFDFKPWKELIICCNNIHSKFLKKAHWKKERKLLMTKIDDKKLECSHKEIKHVPFFLPKVPNVFGIRYAYIVTTDGIILSGQHIFKIFLLLTHTFLSNKGVNCFHSIENLFTISMIYSGNVTTAKRGIPVPKKSICWREKLFLVSHVFETHKQLDLLPITF